MRLSILSLFLCYVISGVSQSNGIPPIISKLYHTPGSVIVFSYLNSNLIELPDLPKNFKYTGQELVKNNKGLFLQPLGTGRLYQLTEKDGEYNWKRIDSTIYTGYNFRSRFFSIDTTFYSFGGEGFFNANGNLRYFNNYSKEWDAANLSRTILWFSLSELFHAIDTTGKYLYVESLPRHHDLHLKENFIADLEHQLWKLDIETGIWQNLGKITEEKSVSYAQTPFGMLVKFNRIIDVKNNKVYRLSKSLQDKIFTALGTSSKPNELAYSFCIDSTLFIGGTGNFIDSITISKADLIEQKKPFYIANEAEIPLGEREIMIGSIILLSLACVFLFVKNKKKGTSQPVAIVGGMQDNISLENDKRETQVTFRSGKLMELLNEREKLLLEFIYKHSLDERLTTIEEINKVIGASQRSAEVQKRLRSDLIGSINDKLEIVSDSKFNVIEKQRSEFDKRSFEYFIHPELMELTEKVLGKKTN